MFQKDYFNLNSSINYSHMLDFKGIRVQKGSLDKSIMTWVLISSYIISNSSVNYILYILTDKLKFHE